MNTMREEFEGWAKSVGIDLSLSALNEGTYKQTPAKFAWQAWQAARQPVGEVVACSGGFVISNGSGKKYMGWGQAGPVWVEDVSRALWLVRRADADALADENEDAQSILPVARCALPPNGWACTLASGHEGPCPTIAAPPQQPERVDLSQFREAVQYASRTCPHEDLAPKLHELLALINQQESRP